VCADGIRSFLYEMGSTTARSDCCAHGFFALQETAWLCTYTDASTSRSKCKPRSLRVAKTNLHCSVRVQVNIRGIGLYKSSRNSAHLPPLVNKGFMRCSYLGAPSATCVLLITERGAQRSALFINVQRQRLMQTTCCSESRSPFEWSRFLTVVLKYVCICQQEFVRKSPLRVQACALPHQRTRDPIYRSM
jgi:hypothetical protein